MRLGGLIAAIVFAAVAAIIVLRMSGGKEEATGPENAPQLSTTNVYVASQVIPIGTELTQDMIAIQPWPQHLVLDGFITADSGTNVVGMISRASFQPQEPIVTSKLSNPSDPNFLAGTLPKGMRVITIQTNETEGVAGFVFPGDFVDVILTHDIQKWVSQPGGSRGVAQLARETETVTETLLTNVKVLAVDQRASGAGATDEQGNLIIPRSISLMVSPSDAQRIRLGQQKGTLTVTLRSLADRESADPLTVTGMGDISQNPQAAKGVTGTSGTADTINVVRGTDAKSETIMMPLQPTDVSEAGGAMQATPAMMGQ